MDPNVKHCILVKKRQSSPTTNPTTTTTYSSTTTNSNTTDDGIQYEYELVDCNGPLEAYRWFSVGICKYKPGYKSHDLL